MEQEKPEWMFVDAERGTELSYGLFNYFPDAHYRRSIDQSLDALTAIEPELEPEGDSPELYFWYNPDADSVIERGASADICKGSFRSLIEAGEALAELKEKYEIPEGELEFDLYIAETFPPH